MAIAYNTGNINLATSSGSSLTLSVPAGVAAGNVMLLGVLLFASVTTTPDFTISTTGSETWEAAAASAVSTNGSTINVTGQIWYAFATATSGGATITASTSNSVSGYWGLEVVAYSGCSPYDPIDQISNNVIEESDSSASPFVTTVESNDWGIFFVLAGSVGNDGPDITCSGDQYGATREVGSTTEEANSIAAGAFDTDFAYAAGTILGSTGANVELSPGAGDSYYTGWTVALAPVQPPTFPPGPSMQMPNRPYVQVFRAGPARAR